MLHKNVIWLNGTFDVLHMGHIKLFEKAHEIACDEFPAFSWEIVVGIDTDERIRKNKGNERPVNNLSDRMEFLRAIRYVDKVHSFNSDEQLSDLVELYLPKFMVIGEDYKNKKIIGSEYIDKIVYVPRYGGLSSSNIINGTYKTSYL
jgi:rfaE bifunctional protein nucleotidyltransferase chain/domain